MKPIDKNIPIYAAIGIPLLKDPYKTIARMRILERKAYKEIAAEMNMSVNFCYICVSRAKKKLKKLEPIFKKHAGDEEALKHAIITWHRTNIE